MTSNSTKLPVLGSDAEIAVGLLDEWFDPIEAALRDRVRELIQTMIESELEAVLARPRYARRPKADPENNGAGGVAGHRHGHRSRSLLGTFGRVEIAVPRARLDTAEGKTTEWKSTALRAYQRRTKQADSLIAGAYLADTNTRRVRRALAAVFGGAVSKSLPSRRRGYREPGVAEGESRLGCLECPLARRGTDRSLDPRRHGGAGQARPQGHLDRAAGRARGARGRPEGAAGGQEYGWRDQPGLARRPRRPRQARTAQAGVSDCRWRDRAGAGAGRVVGRCADPTLHRPQASQPARPRAPAAARRGLSRLQRHDLRRLACRDQRAPPSLPSQMAAQMQGGSRQPRGGR